MREMQQKVFREREAQYLLVKAPPASGKSRALMFVGLDKLYNQGRKKVIVAVPERSIGSSFSSTELTNFGFFADWIVDARNNLCTPGGSAGKVEQFLSFMQSQDSILICTHATLRFAFEKLPANSFDGVVLAIDEFHHVSADVNSSRLGELLKQIMAGSDAHIIAMTGSYFRGDSVPVLSPEDEEKFTPVTFNYYDQLNGYQYLKSLGIGHHFYQGRYTSAIHEILDLDKKTLIHIPNVNSGESTKDKIEEVGAILDTIGTVISQEKTGIILVRRKDNNQILRVADLVDDSDTLARSETLSYLGEVAAIDRDAVDIIIALGMAKEGFDWPFCEHALTVGYRASLTEVIQIIGRATRDSEGKTHAQFTNLVAQPDASNDDVKLSVNNMLKAITASLLMEQVLAPNFTFKTKRNDDDDRPRPGELKIRGFKEPSSARVQQIVDTDLNDLKATILQNEGFVKAAASNVEPEIANKILIPKIIRERYPDLNEVQVEELRQQVVVDSAIKTGEVRHVGDKRFIKMSDKFVNIDDIDINLIDRINPFQKAFEILSKSVTPQVLRVIQDTIATTRIDISEEEALALWPKVQLFAKVNGRPPDIRAEDATEVKYAEVLLFLQKKKREADREI
jgi:superfamily II DNA or RNA helicase